MWDLYRVLKNGIGNHKYLVDEVLDILDGISKEDFLQSLLLLYPKIDFTQHNPVEMATLFISGLKHNNFFAFVDVIQGLEHGNSKR
jgi:hypothetical protein